jgi:hypothetical protein
VHKNSRRLPLCARPPLGVATISTRLILPYHLETVRWGRRWPGRSRSHSPSPRLSASPPPSHHHPFGSSCLRTTATCSCPETLPHGLRPTRQSAEYNAHCPNGTPMQDQTSNPYRGLAPIRTSDPLTVWRREPPSGQEVSSSHLSQVRPCSHRYLKPQAQTLPSLKQDTRRTLKLLTLGFLGRGGS